MFFSQFQNAPEQVFLNVLPLVLLGVAAFLLLVLRKKVAAVMAFGVAVVGYSTQAAVHTFKAGQLDSAAIWASIAIAAIVGVTLILKLTRPANPSVKSESE